ncbi:MAG TPA: BatA and WFA domain-containing protein [Bryobacteraceae bacterium]|nr:BatA and WFA domain-containing protein [Bryobacteraceae bacterium]
MYFLNLSLAQFLAVFGTIAAVSIALYLLDRSRRRQVVSTLRFWVAADQPSVVARRKRIQQPWSLILQLISMALILLALAQLRFGSPDAAGRDHVLILETSAWMAARSGNRTLMDIARQRARQYVRAIPAGDHIMVVRADALATPATVFEPDRAKIDAAIAGSTPGSTALNLEQALAFARRLQSQVGRTAGEIAFVGTGRTTEMDSAAMTAPPRNLRVIPVPDAIENSGLRRIGLRRSNEDPDVWEIYVSTRNYGAMPRTVNLAVDFGPPKENTRTVVGARRLTLQPGADGEETFEFRTRAAGILGVSLTPHDAFPGDDKATLELPAQPSLTVTVYSDRPELLRPLLAANPRVVAFYRKPAEFQPNAPGLVILDHFAPPQRPQGDSIWIEPPPEASPIPVRTTVDQAPFSGWNSASPIAAGLRAKDFKLERAEVFASSPADESIGSVDGGPVIVARAGTPKIAVLGFHPALSALRYELATPLLFANLLRWLAPEIFRRSELSGGSVGAVKMTMEQDRDAAGVQVVAEDGSALPFTVRDRALHFFAGAPGVVRVVAGDREYIYSLTLPELGETKWQPPEGVRRGIPRSLPVPSTSHDLWPWLALAGGLGLLAEWYLFGRFRRTFGRRPVPLRPRAPAEVEVAHR